MFITALFIMDKKAVVHIHNGVLLSHYKVIIFIKLLDIVAPVLNKITFKSKIILNDFTSFRPLHFKSKSYKGLIKAEQRG